MKVTALKIRQALGSVLKTLEKTDQPIIIEKNREQVAVLISMEQYRKRFVDYQDEEKRDELLELLIKTRKKASIDSLSALRQLRYGD
jgi:PHD/YefM family antitoxin component YafN of YafNO toxin-antitoxin module